MTITIKENQKLCMKCEKVKTKSHFYKSMSEWHGDSTFPYCKHCVKGLVNLNDEYAIHTFLIQLDRPFLSDLWEKAVNDDKETLGRYLAFFNVGGDKNKRYKDGEIYSKDNKSTAVQQETTDNSVVKMEIDSVKVSNEDLSMLANFWGRGYTREDLIYLQSEYEEWINRYECDSKGMETLIQEICQIRLDINKRRENSEKVDTQLKTLQDLLGSSNLKPVQETGANAVEQESFGTLIKKYENERPIPEPDEKWKDVDKISKYVRVFFLGHLSRMLNLNNQYKDEYWEEVNKYTVEEPIVEDEDGDKLGRD